MFILFDPSCTPMWVSHINPYMSKKHGIASKVFILLISILYLEDIQQSHRCHCFCLIPCVESNCQNKPQDYKIYIDKSAMGWVNIEIIVSLEYHHSMSVIPGISGTAE